MAATTHSLHCTVNDGYEPQFESQLVVDPSEQSGAAIYHSLMSKFGFGAGVPMR